LGSIDAILLQQTSGQTDNSSMVLLVWQTNSLDHLLIPKSINLAHYHDKLFLTPHRSDLLRKLLLDS
jgi:hypothetical protein